MRGHKFYLPQSVEACNGDSNNILRVVGSISFRWAHVTVVVLTNCNARDYFHVTILEVLARKPQCCPYANAPEQ
jgi:hypothetical protein